jgi:hypothetical protein
LIIFSWHVIMSRCGYDCSAEPLPLHPDSDITGIGIVTNYIATASIAVLIITIYYLGIFKQVRTLSTGVAKTIHFIPSPVDEIFLRAVRWAPKHILRRTLKSRRMSPYASIRLQQTFIKVSSFFPLFFRVSWLYWDSSGINIPQVSSSDERPPNRNGFLDPDQ